MIAITADLAHELCVQNPPFGRALEALTAILAQYGQARMAAWARAADDDATRIVAVMFENTTLALALLRDLDRAHRSGNPRARANGGLWANTFSKSAVMFVPFRGLEPMAKCFLKKLAPPMLHGAQKVPATRR
jgi:hypothetical protein